MKRQYKVYLSDLIGENIQKASGEVGFGVRTNLVFLDSLSSEDIKTLNLSLFKYLVTDDLEKENERLNNIIKKAIHFINLNQDSKKLTLNYNDLKKLRGILNNDEYYLTLFEEQLNELKENS